MNNKKIIYINIDGFSYSYYQALKEEGYELFENLKDKGLFFENLKSGVVSITNPMQSAMLCGALHNQTNNIYQHYDAEKKEVVKHKRRCDAENISQMFEKMGLDTLSIHQFILENNPNIQGDKKKAYIQTQFSPSRFQDRFNIFFNILDKKPVLSGKEYLTYDSLPHFIALYLDDIDSLGHNNAYDEIPARKEFEERWEDIKKVLLKIESNIQILIEKLKKNGEWENVILCISTDHGMTPFRGKSSLGKLIDAISDIGISASTPENVDNKTEICILPYTIETSLYFLKDISKAKRAKLEEILANEPYILGFKNKRELVSEYGYPTWGAEYIVSASYGNHFYKRDFDEYFGASHDSFHETSQHIFGMIISDDIKGKTIKKETRNIELLPAITQKLYKTKMKNSIQIPTEEWWSE